jgi:hypothetical protein
MFERHVPIYHFTHSSTRVIPISRDTRTSCAAFNLAIKYNLVRFHDRRAGLCDAKKVILSAYALNQGMK